jgi:hypothetical protein
MDYQNLVRDFAQRTRVNLETLRRVQQTQPDQEVYEVTQLINSMLGLLVLPQQWFMRRIPEIPLEQLVADGWPRPVMEGEFPPAANLQELVRYLRNAIAHFNLAFVADDQGQICGLRLWNRRGGVTTWEARLALADLETITEKFIDLLLEVENRDGQPPLLQP